MVQALCKRRNFAFRLSLELMWLRGQRVVWHYGWVPLIISLDPAKFGGTGVVQEKKFRFSFVAWPHVTSWSEGHVTLWVSSPYYKSRSCQVWWNRRCAREEISFFVCRLTSCDFVVRESCDIVAEFSSSLVTTLQSLVIVDLLEEDIKRFQFVTWLHVTTRSEDQVTSWVSSHYHKSPSC